MDFVAEIEHEQGVWDVFHEHESMGNTELSSELCCYSTVPLNPGGCPTSKVQRKLR